MSGLGTRGRPLKHVDIIEKNLQLTAHSREFGFDWIRSNHEEDLYLPPGLSLKGAAMHVIQSPYAFNR